MRIAITTDTNCGMLQSDREGLFVIPMPILIEGETFYEGQDLSHQDLYQQMHQHKNVSTSQPSPAAVMDLWNDILSQVYDEILHIPMSSALSGSCNSAQVFALEYEERVHVVDNHRLSVTHRESVETAYTLAQQGWSARQIKEHLEAHTYDARIYVAVDTLEYLKKGGRITAGAAAIATVLHIKPVLGIQGENPDAFAKARGMKQALKIMINAIKADREAMFSQYSDDQLMVQVAGSFETDEQKEQLRQQVQAEFPQFEVTYHDLPCSLVCHCGINAGGIGLILNEAKIVSC